MHTVIIIVGSTAVGKTAFAIKLAQHFNTQIISADSRQCFKELNIGVAKPTVAELKMVPHHFINSHSITQEVNAAVFEQYALNKVNDIFKQNNIAVMVGGTGLYVKAFCEGMDAMPIIPTAIRDEIIMQYEKLGLPWLQAQLQIKDPFFWQTAEQQNPQRLMRALEVINATGQSITHFKQNKKTERPFNIIKIGLELPKEQLYNNINTRIDAMMQEGLLEEVQSLISFKNLNALQTVGYKELFECIEGKPDVEKAIEQIKLNSRHYAKRQMTWFKKDTTIQWLNAATVTIQKILPLVSY